MQPRFFSWILILLWEISCKHLYDIFLPLLTINLRKLHEIITVFFRPRIYQILPYRLKTNIVIFRIRLIFKSDLEKFFHSIHKFNFGTILQILGLTRIPCWTVSTKCLKTHLIFVSLISLMFYSLQHFIMVQALNERWLSSFQNFYDNLLSCHSNTGCLITDRTVQSWSLVSS